MSPKNYIGPDPFVQTAINSSSATINTQLDTVSAGALKSITTYATPGSFTYTPASGISKLIVHVIGGGGGGGAAGTTMSGSGGGAGGYSCSLVSSVSGTYPVVVGSGGPSVTAGGFSSFNTTIIGNGGSAGVSNTTNGAGGAGGTASGGTILNITGGTGDPPFSTTRPGMGGDSAYLNGGGRTRASAGVGNAGLDNTGGGGAGGHTSANAGGAGGDGIVIIYEYGISV